jgi:RNA polymerase-binding transcription factor DksA
MRHHFHRCSHLRVVSVPASEQHGARRGGGVILEELCDARNLTDCVGLVECEILTPRQKQDLLVERATRIREKEGRPTELSGVPAGRGSELGELRDELVRERERIVDENLRVQAEMGFADAELPPGHAGEPGLAVGALSIHFDEALDRLQHERLDEIDRALEAMQELLYGTCALCGAGIDLERLRASPRTRVCAACARGAPPPGAPS